MQNYTEIVHRFALLRARASVHMDLRARGFKLAIKLNCTMAQYGVIKRFTLLQQIISIECYLRACLESERKGIWL